MRFRTLFVLSCALSAAASPALAQRAPRPLTPTVASPIAFQIGVPRGWEVRRVHNGLNVTDAPAVITINAVDMVDAAKVDPRLTDAEARRQMTETVMGSDSALFTMMKRINEMGGQPVPLQDVVYEIGRREPFLDQKKKAKDGKPGVSLDWFNMLYQVLLGQEKGPRFGSFVAVYGLQNTVEMIDGALARSA